MGLCTQEMAEPNLNLKRALPAVLALLLLTLPNWARADGINGYVEYGYNLLNSTSTNSGTAIDTSGSTFNQRYNLTMVRSLYPTLRLSLGGTVQLDKSDTETSGQSSTSSSSRINPNADLSYQGTYITSGVGFSRRMDSSTTNGVSSPISFFDNYNARLSWLPEDLPTLNLIFSTFNSFDEHYSSRDTTSTTTSLSSRYKLTKNLDVNYQGSISNLTDRINGLDSETIGHALRTSYNDNFLKNRLAVSSSYNISTQDSEIHSKSGQNDRLLSKLTDYYARTDNNRFPITSPHTIDDTTPTLSPGSGFATNIPTTTSIPLTFNSAASAPPTYSDHLGMQFSDILPLADKIRVVVRPTYSTGSGPLPQTLTDLFSDTINGWKVFASRDGRTWNQVTGLTFARDTTFSSLDGTGTEAVTISFSAVQAQYLKVVTRPVDLAPVLSNQVTSVEFTHLDAFIKENINPTSGRKSSQLAGIYNLNLRGVLWDLPMLQFDSGFNLNHNKSDTTDLTYAYTLVNGLSIFHNFSPRISGSARLSREDAVTQTTSRSSNAASVSLTATPLPTLFYSLSYSAKQEQEAGLSRTSHAVNLSNTAELYRGISASLTVGGGMSNDSTGLDQKNFLMSMGISLTPHKSVGINLSGSDSRSWTSGGGQQDNNSFTRAADANISYTPFRGLFLFGGYTISAQSQLPTQTAQSFGGSWSPFRDGALLLNISYRESIQNDGTKDRSLSNSLRWTIRQGTFLDLGYQVSSGSAPDQKTEAQTFSALLRISI